MAPKGRSGADHQLSVSSIMMCEQEEEEEEEEEQQQQQHSGGGIIALAFSTCLRACLLAGGAAGSTGPLNKTIRTDTCSRQGATES
jgi:hypothetical protein